MSIPDLFVNTRPWRFEGFFLSLVSQGKRKHSSVGFYFDCGGIGAGDGNRTHDIQLGKLTFYL
jgi:hypothetical protein